MITTDSVARCGFDGVCGQCRNIEPDVVFTYPTSRGVVFAALCDACADQLFAKMKNTPAGHGLSIKAYTGSETWRVAEKWRKDFLRDNAAACRDIDCHP